MIIPTQPITAIATAAVGVAVVILSAASMSNMYETYAIVKQHRQQLPRRLTSVVVSKANSWRSIDEAVEGLKNMNKRDLVELFLHCDAPEISDLSFSDGNQDWRYDGTLLDNGPLTPVANFITNRLFGRGRLWLGKAYLQPSSTSNGVTFGIGKNRFHNRQQTNENTEGELLDRTFGYSIDTSVLPSPSQKSLFNRYSTHCPSLSPMSFMWQGMVDELRVVRLKDRSMKVLLGMGYFTWSGGTLNLAPFCLVARNCEDAGHKIN